MIIYETNLLFNEQKQVIESKTMKIKQIFQSLQIIIFYVNDANKNL